MLLRSSSSEERKQSGGAYSSRTTVANWKMLSRGLAKKNPETPVNLVSLNQEIFEYEHGFTDSHSKTEAGGGGSASD